MFSTGSIVTEHPRSRANRLLTAGLFLTLFAASATSAYAQTADTGGQMNQDCPPAPPLPEAPPRAPEPCITLDARKSVDSLAGPMVFRWKMGDGQEREGVTFDYCYAKPGRYIIQLDVMDGTTGEVRQHENEQVVDFTIPPPAPAHEPALRFSAPEKAKVGEPVTFQLTEAELPPCLPSTIRYNWNFRDGLLGQGKTITRSFRRAGTYSVRLAIDGSGIGPDCLQRLCVTRQIIIEP